MAAVGGRVAIITGGASGIGAAAARAFVQAGAKVVITDINDAGGSALSAEIGEEYGVGHA